MRKNETVPIKLQVFVPISTERDDENSFIYCTSLAISYI